MSADFIENDVDFDQVKLKDPSGELAFHEYVNDPSNFSSSPQMVDYGTRLRRGLLFSGSDNPKRGTIVIAFRGTVTASDVNTDRVFLQRNLPSVRALGVTSDLRTSNRYIRNRQFIVEQMNTYFNGEATNGNNSYWDFYVTGHSLGGALSETLSADKLVHGGYSFSAPVDNPTNSLAYTDENTGQRVTRSMNAPTYRSMNKYDKVIGGVTDATTGGDAIYDDLINGKVLTRMAGHDLTFFRGQQLRTPFQIPPYRPGVMHRLITGPIESSRRLIKAVTPAITPVAQRISQAPSYLSGQLRSGFRRITGYGRKRARLKKGRGPPPAYSLALSLASDAYKENFANPQKHDVGVQQAILCPAPISCQEVKFYVIRWPLFNSDEERNTIIGPLVKILTETPMTTIPAFDTGNPDDAPEEASPEDDYIYENPLIGQGVY